MKKFLTLIIIYFVINSCAFAQEKAPFLELTKQHLTAIDKLMNDNEKAKYSGVASRTKFACDEFQRNCVVDYEHSSYIHLVLFYFPDDKTMYMSIYNNVIYRSSNLVTFSELGVKFNDVIMTVPLENNYNIEANTYNSMYDNFTMNNRVHGRFAGKDLEKLRKIFKSCNVISTKRLLGYKHELQCENKLTCETKIYPMLNSFVGGYHVPKIGMHDLLFYSSLLQKIGYRWIDEK